MQEKVKKGPEWGDLKVAAVCLSVVGGMVGLSFASVPLYDLFCRVTGFGGTTQVSTEAPVAPAGVDRVITVRFDASKHRDMRWNFKAEQVSMEAPVGEAMLAFYSAHNPTDKPITGMATYNVTPPSAGIYFSKVHCFCFEEQTLQPGERMDMPVSFYINPLIAEEPELDHVETITLSYTFFETPRTAQLD